jgi:hypothetical protein
LLCPGMLTMVFTQDLFNSLTSIDGETISTSGLDKDNLFETLKNDEKVFFIDNTPTTELRSALTQEFKKDELLDALKSQPTPLKPEASPPPPEVKKQVPETVNELNIKTTTPMADNDKKEETSAISEEDLLKILNGEI